MRKMDSSVSVGTVVRAGGLVNEFLVLGGAGFMFFTAFTPTPGLTVVVHSNNYCSLNICILKGFINRSVC
jgi:hypothetical protein